MQINHRSLWALLNSRYLHAQRDSLNEEEESNENDVKQCWCGRKKYSH